MDMVRASRKRGTAGTANTSSPESAAYRQAVESIKAIAKVSIGGDAVEEASTSGTTSSASGNADEQTLVFVMTKLGEHKRLPVGVVAEQLKWPPARAAAAMESAGKHGLVQFTVEPFNGTMVELTTANSFAR